MTPEDGSAPAQAAAGAQPGTDSGFRPFSTGARRLAEGGAGALVAAFVHLLRQNDWARAKLAMFAGRRIRFGIDTPSLGPLPAPRLTARVTDDGLLEVMRGSVDDPIDVHMLLRPSVDTMFALVRADLRALAPHLRLDGEVMLAAALGEIVEHLRWDVEEDLSRLTGDVLARRIGEGVASVRATVRELRSRIESSTGRHLAGDSGQLVGRGELASLRSALDALEARLARLETPSGQDASPSGHSAAAGAPPAPAGDREAPLPQLQPPLELPRFDFDPEGPKPPE